LPAANAFWHTSSSGNASSENVTYDIMHTRNHPDNELVDILLAYLIVTVNGHFAMTIFPRLRRLASSRLS